MALVGITFSFCYVQVDRFMDMVMTMQEIAAMRRHSKLDLMAPIPPQQTAPQAPPARAGDTIATGRQPRAAAVAATVAVANGLAEQVSIRLLCVPCLQMAEYILLIFFAALAIASSPASL